jgi:hypothetical protein
MADNLSDVFETNVLDLITHTTGSTNYVQPGSLWVGLCSTAPTDAAPNETSGSGYARVTMNMRPATTGQNTGPAATCTFPQASASWGTISGYAVFAASTGSTGASQYLWYGVVSPTVAVTTNDTVSFAADAMTLTMG